MTEVEVQKLLSDLSTLSKKLNTEVDSLNGLVQRIEEQLRVFNVGFDVSVGDGPSFQLMWTKGKGKDWHLLVGNNSGVMPLSAASRSDRIGALPLLPQLLMEMKTKAADALSKIERAKQVVGQLDIAGPK